VLFHVGQHNRPDKFAKVFDEIEQEKCFENGKDDIFGAPHPKFLVVPI
jgi:hypothetical protein